MTSRVKTWLIVNLSRGIFDGFYFQGGMFETVEDIMPILEHWRKAQPEDNIILTEVISSDQAHMPDDRFMPDFVFRKSGGRS